MHNSLHALLRVRALALDEAKRDLASALRAEQGAATAVEASEAEIVREAAIAEDPAAGDAQVEAFASWLRIARQRLENAQMGHGRAIAETGRARAALAACRAAHEAARMALERAEEELRLQRLRQEQLALDEIAQHGRKR